MMFSCVAELADRKEADLIVLPFWQEPKKVREATSLGELAKNIKGPIEARDFKGEKNETALIYLSGKVKEKRILLLGLGKENELSVEGLRQSYAAVVKFCQTKGISRINVLLPNIALLRGLTLEECLTGIGEGLLLTNYVWHQLMNLDEETVLLKSVSLIGVVSTLAIAHLEKLEHIAYGVYLARDLINGNADQVTPQHLANVAKEIAKKQNVTATIFDKKQIEKEKMGLLLAVARGSMHDPAFIILSYKGNARSKDHTVLIGKGVTYDTGGLNLKPTGFMETMREDMSGAALALATIAVAAELKLPVNVTAVVAATENSIDAKSYKPGDVYVSYSGKSVEVGNTDAEGRLTLADAIGYSVKHLTPTRIINFATLTGSIVVALGEGVAGLFCNNDKLTQELLQASALTYEPLWQMPLHAPYKEMLKSDIADLKNVSGGRAAGAITAALFLEHFVEGLPWAHVDIAGTAFLEKERHYWPKNAVGFGVRLMIQFLTSLKKQ